MNHILFATLRTALSGRSIDENLFVGLSEEEWNRMFRLSCQHNVVALVFGVLEQLPAELQPPREVLLKWAVVAEQSVEKYHKREVAIGELARIWSENDIRTMLLKGVGISYYYPQPELRTFIDIDVYNFGEIDKADAVIEQQFGVRVDGDVHHHTTFVYKGILIENHFDFVNTASHRSNGLYEAILKSEANKDFKTAEIGGTTVCLPSPMFNALFLMRHTALHYAAARISLRHLLDWKLFLEAEHDNIDFERINATSEQFNMRRFADAVNGILIEHFAMSAAIVPPFSRDRELEERIFDDIVNPAFTAKQPKGLLKIVWWKTRRFMANRWKHELIYNESWVRTFFRSSYAHLQKPKTIAH